MSLISYNKKIHFQNCLCQRGKDTTEKDVINSPILTKTHFGPRVARLFLTVHAEKTSFWKFLKSKPHYGHPNLDTLAESGNKLTEIMFLLGRGNVWNIALLIHF